MMNPGLTAIGALGALFLFWVLGEDDAAPAPGPGPGAPSGPPKPPFAQPEAAKLQSWIENAVNSGDPKVYRATATKIRNTKWSPQIAGEASQAANDLDALALATEAGSYAQGGEYEPEGYGIPYPSM